MAERDDEELSWWDELRPPDGDADELGLPPPPPADGLSALDLVQSMLRQPLLGESTPPPAPTLRSAATELLRSSGLFGEPKSTRATPTSAGSSIAADGEQRPRSWKLPPSMNAGISSIIGNDTATGPGSGTAPSATPAPTAPLEPAVPATASPLDHPDAQTGLALTAADSLIRRGAELIAGVAGGNRAIVEQVVNAAVQWIGGLLPAEYKASAAKTGEVALAGVMQRLDDNATALRRRGAIGTLAHRRAEAEHEHTHAILAGDRAKIDEARRDAIEAWSAERRARGDGESEINAGARTLERAYRKAALRQRLAQLDSAAIDRALSEDEHAKADPALAREVAADILHIRREDPARVAEVSIEREIEARKRDGRIDTPEEETAVRYSLRLEAQTKRGIPEDQRRLLTNDERTRLATEYRRIESAQGKSAADAWFNGEVSKAGSNAERFGFEIVAAPKARDLEQNGSGLSTSGPPRHLAELPGADVDPPPSSKRPDSESAEHAAPSKRVEAEDRRQLEPPATSYSVGAEFGVEQPTSPLRELRKLIGRIRSVSAFKDGGAPLMSDDKVVAYVEEARKYIRPEYQDIFEITVLAVRTGMIPWWRAQERLREYFAPESTGEAILDGILDFLPVVGQVKGTIEIGEALDGLRIALDESDEAGAVKFAADAALLLAGLIPILKAGKFAKHIPGLEKLKDVLGEFAGGRLPFHKFLEQWNKDWKIHGHHSFPIFLGGMKKEGVAELRVGVHRDLHKELNALLRGIVDAEGRHMRPQKGNAGWVIRRNFSPEERIRVMADFYTGPGNRLKYRNARREFFRLFPELAQ
jgi:hypothetical protein